MEDFDNNLQHKMGFAKKRLLKGNVVPTINIAYNKNHDLNEEHAQRIEGSENNKTVDLILENHSSSLLALSEENDILQSIEISVENFDIAEESSDAIEMLLQEKQSDEISSSDVSDFHDLDLKVSDADDDPLSCHWINWCRLCTRDDKHNINILNSDISKSKKLNLQQALEKYFGIQISSQDSLPKSMCMNCFSLVSAMINFNEYVERVQRMFSHLDEAQDISKFVDLNTVRHKFNVTEYERDHCLNNFLLINENDLNDLQINENYNHSSNDELLETQIKEENVENTAMNYNIYIEKDVESEDKEEYVFADNLSDALPQDEFPFEYDEAEGNVVSSENVKEIQPPQNNSQLSIKNTNLDKSKKKIMRKKLRPLSSKKYLQKKSAIKDIKIEVSCKECGNHFSKYMSYREHMQQKHKHSKSEKHWPCPVCDKIFVSLYKINRHIRIHMPMEIRRRFKCTECDNRYTTNTQLQAHIRINHKNEKIICEKCGLRLASSSYLRQHMLIHNDLAPFECEVCKKKFKDKARLKNHVNIHSSKKHECHICGLQLNSRATLNQHFLVHSDEVRHRCDECGKGFKRTDAFKNHLLSHVGLMLYSCDFCEKSFGSRSTCRRHMERIHPEEFAIFQASGNKAYTKNIPRLETLKAVTKTADNLKPVAVGRSGSKKGNKYECNICGLQLNSSSTLYRHHTVHSEEMRHKCDYCGKAFKRTYNYRNHLLSHTDLPQYSCDYCEKSFGLDSICRAHMKKMHAEELAVEKKTNDKDNNEAKKSKKSKNKLIISNSMQGTNEEITDRSSSSTPLDFYQDVDP